LLRHPVVTGATMALRRDVRNYLFPLPRAITHDRWISFLLAVRGRVAIVASPLMQYRKHSGQQIGVGPQSVKERIERARRTHDRFYEEEIDLLTRFCERLGTFPTNSSIQSVLSEIHRKMRHLENRLRFRRRGPTRIPGVLREVCNRGYWKYSAGWESVAKDLLLLGAI
jgi:hypothetical protein